MSNESLKEELMIAYKEWENHQRTTEGLYDMGNVLWDRYVCCRNRWHEYSYYAHSHGFN